MDKIIDLNIIYNKIYAHVNTETVNTWRFFVNIVVKCFLKWVPV
jgi:hypothetical protein